jgi:aspartyl-tRNA synthetase
MGKDLTPGQAFGLSATTSAISAIGSTYSSVVSQRAEAEYKRSQLEINRQLAEMRAKDAISRGEKSTEQLKKQTKKLIGSQRTALAAQGINIEGGSALDVQVDTAELSALDALAIKANAYREAFGYRSQALGYGGQAAFTGIASAAAQRQTIATGGLGFLRETMRDYATYFPAKPKASAGGKP